MPGTVLHGDNIIDNVKSLSSQSRVSYERTDIKQVEYVCEVVRKPNKGDTESWGGEMLSYPR